MTASYPSSIASFTTRLDGDVIDNSHMNSVQEEIVAVESTLGTGLLAKSSGAYDAVTSSYSSVSGRLANIERGVGSTDEAIHPQYLPKSGGTVYPPSGDVVSLIVRQSPDATEEVFQVKDDTGSSEHFSVHSDGTTNTYGRLIAGKGIEATTNADLARNLRLLSGETYSGAVVESIRGTTPTATLSATGNLTLAGNLVVGGTISASSLANFQHTHENDAQGGRVIPAGAIMPWAGTGAIPDGWLLCDGQTVLRSSYPGLFAAIGEAYGAGDGSTTFQVPNLKGRVPVGIDASQSEFASAGKSGGSKASVATHSHDIADHSHSGTTGSMSANASHAHAYVLGYRDDGNFTGVSGQNPAADGPGAFGNGTSTASASTDHSHAFTTSKVNGAASASVGMASGNLQPFISLSFLVKA